MFNPLFSFINTIHNDVAEPWQLGFQDSAAPGFSGIEDLHDTLGFYLIFISISVFWVIFNIIYYYNNSKNPIAYKYLTHGSKTEPIYFSKIKNIKNKNIRCISVNVIHLNKFIFYHKNFNNKFYFKYYELRQFSSSSKFFKDKYLGLSNYDSISLEENIKIKPVKYYNNIYDLKSIIIKENKNKSGIYKFTNKLNGKFYIGSSVNLRRRFANYFSLAYISGVKNHLTISRALIKYGYFNFELEILEYCNTLDLLIREQYYIDILKPKYNIAKIASSTIGIKKSEKQKNNISKAIKGKYIGEKSALFGKTHSLETKKLMSLAKSGIKNPLYGKTHTYETKILMRNKKLGKTLSQATKEKLIKAKGQITYLYKLKNYTAEGVKQTKDNYILIKKFYSIRELGRYFKVSQSTISSYLKSGKIFKNCYKISNTLF